jgi:hypothetical protein
VKEFVTQALTPKEQKAIDDEGKIVFMHDGREVVFFMPGAAQLAALLQLSAVIKSHDAEELDPQVLMAYVETFFGLMDKETQRHFRTRMLDRNDPFELTGPGGVSDILNFVVGEWSGGRPTKKPSGSQPSRRATGKGSTGITRAKASTSAPSRSRASSR